MEQSLEQISHEVNVRLQKANEYRKTAIEKSQPASEDRRRAKDHRIAAGMLLIEARKKVDAGEAGNIGWHAWLKQNIERSIRDCQKVMKIAGYIDPQEALEEEQLDSRRRKNSPPPPVEELVLEFKDLLKDQQDEFLRQIGAFRLTRAA